RPVGAAARLCLPARAPGRLGADAQTRDAELVRELAGAGSDRIAHLLGLEQRRLAALREDLADQPFLAPDGHLGERRPVLEGRRAAFAPPRGGPSLGVHPLRRPRVTQAARLDRGAGLECVLRAFGAAHAVKPEAPLGVARAAPRVPPPVRQL